MDPWTIGASLLGGLLAGRGGGGGGNSYYQDRLLSAQADIADLMRRQMQHRYDTIEMPFMGRAMDNVFGFTEGLLNDPRDVLWAPGIFEPLLREQPTFPTDRSLPPGGPWGSEGYSGPYQSTWDRNMALMDPEVFKKHQEDQLRVYTEGKPWMNTLASGLLQGREPTHIEQLTDLTKTIFDPIGAGLGNMFSGGPLVNFAPNAITATGGQGGIGGQGGAGGLGGNVDPGAFQGMFSPDTFRGMIDTPLIDEGAFSGMIAPGAITAAGGQGGAGGLGGNVDPGAFQGMFSPDAFRGMVDTPLIAEGAFSGMFEPGFLDLSGWSVNPMPTAPPIDDLDVITPVDTGVMEVPLDLVPGGFTPPIDEEKDDGESPFPEWMPKLDQDGAIDFMGDGGGMPPVNMPGADGSGISKLAHQGEALADEYANTFGTGLPEIVDKLQRLRDELPDIYDQFIGSDLDQIQAYGGPDYATDLAMAPPSIVEADLAGQGAALANEYANMGTAGSDINLFDLAFDPSPIGEEVEDSSIGNVVFDRLGGVEGEVFSDNMLEGETTPQVDTDGLVEMQDRLADLTNAINRFGDAGQFPPSALQREYMNLHRAIQGMRGMGNG